METTIHTVHAHPRGGETLMVVGDATHPLGILPPVWALWRGLWLNASVQLAILVAVAAFLPAASGAVWLGLVALVLLEGPTLERLEWRLRGWREVGWVDAATEEGAEEAYLTGKAHAA